MSDMIQAQGLAKRYGKVTALDGVDLTVPTGTVLGLLGPNGAGKTTIVRILATLALPDAGSARIGGFDVVADAPAARRLIGLTGQYAAVDEDLTGTENLVLIARLLGLPRADAKRRAAELLERFDLADAAGRPVKGYSGGMRRRLDLAASLTGRPRVLFLDEPTTGLDPRARGEVWEVIRGLVADGVTVLLTTQYLDEADKLADRIAVIDHGRLVAEGTAAELKSRTGGLTVEVRPADRGELAKVRALVAEVPGVVSSAVDGGLVAAAVRDRSAMPAVVRHLDAAGVEVDELALRQPSLDEVFFALTGDHPAVGGPRADHEGAAA